MYESKRILATSVLAFVLSASCFCGSADAVDVFGGGQAFSGSAGCTPRPDLGECVVEFGFAGHGDTSGASGHLTFNWTDLRDNAVAEIFCITVLSPTEAVITGNITQQKNGAATGGFFSRVAVHITSAGDPAGQTLFGIFDNDIGCALFPYEVPVFKGHIDISP
jgi:hypothetical protein